MIETLSHIAGHFDVLLLILTHGHDIGVVEQDVGRHQDGVRKQPVVNRVTPIHGRLVGMGPLEHPHWGHGSQDPGQLSDFGDIALSKQDRFFGIEAGPQIVECDRLGVAPA